MAMREHLHLDVELPAALIAGLDVQDRQLVVQRLLGIEGIEQVDVANVVAGGRLQDLVDHIDQQRPRGRASEEMFERVVHLGIDFQEHRGLSARHGSCAESTPALYFVSLRLLAHQGRGLARFDDFALTFPSLIRTWIVLRGFVVVRCQRNQCPSVAAESWTAIVSLNGPSRSTTS